MTSFHPLHLNMDSFSQYLHQELDYPEPTISSSILHFPLSHALESEHHYPSFNLLSPHYCNHSLPPPLPPPGFILFHELGLDRALSCCNAAPERKWKWKWKAEFKGNGFEYKWKAETKGDVEKKVTWTVDVQGKGKHAPLRSRVYQFQPAAAAAAAALSPPQYVCENVNKEWKGKGAAGRAVEIGEGMDQKLVFRKEASRNRSVQKSKGKKKEHSPQDAAMAIQRTFRDYMSRRSKAVHCLRDLAVAKSKLKEIRILISKFSYRNRLAKDAEERQRFSEKIIILLLTVDVIEAPDYLARSAKRSMTRELEAILEAVDPHLMRQRKFDLPSCSSNAMASGVADVVRMLDEEEANGNGILPVFER